MVAAGVAPDVIAYSSLVQAWARVGDTERARAVFDKMKTEGLPPNSFTYTNLLLAYRPQSSPLCMALCPPLVSEGKPQR